MRLIRSLGRRKGREAAGKFLVEGERAIADALSAGIVPDAIVVRDGYQPTMESLRAVSDSLGDELRVLHGPLFDDLSDTVNPQGILAIMPIPMERSLASDASFVVLLDGIRDPGNMGTLLRSAAAAGADAVLVGDGSVDIYNPKVVRSAMGAHFRVPVLPVGQVEHDQVAAMPVRAIADARASVAYDRVDWQGPCLVIVGSEATGPGEASRALANVEVSIPMVAGIESLNAAVSAAVILFEIARQRRTGRGSALK